ncbi:MAG: hypothetical protein SFY95_10500 [Planctomycetota bacterium]|nr:hypothetical protein [Planctomycetota bacterium]
MRRRTTSVTTFLTLGLLAASAATLGGCYANYPPVEGNVMATTDPNTRDTRDAIVTALRHVFDRYGVVTADGSDGGPVAINLPTGARKDTYDQVAKAVGPNVNPISRENVSTMPVYHIARVWLRSSDARIDVLRPMPELGATADGNLVYQCVTVHMRAYLSPWKVTQVQTREPGIVDVPGYTFPGETAVPRVGPPWQPSKNAPKAEGTTPPADEDDPGMTR